MASMLSSHTTKVQTARVKVESSRLDRKAKEDAIAEIDVCLRKSESLRAESQRALNELYVVQTVLNRTREKLRVISKELNECR